MKTLYIADLDGTLLDSRCKIRRETADAVNHVRKKGHCFSIATARSRTSALELVSGIADDTPAVLHNGAFVQRLPDGDILHHEGMGNAAERIREIYEAAGIFPLVYALIDGKERVSWLTGRITPEVSGYLRRRGYDERLREVGSPEQLYSGEIYYMTVISQRKKLEPAYQEIRRAGICRALLQPEIYRDEFWLELMSGRATKANGVRRLKEFLNCDRIVCFGDGQNDVPLFEISDESYAVRNAAPELKRLATGVIPCNDDSGVAKWLMKHV